MPRRLWAVLAVSLGAVVAVLDGAIANVALPTIARDLGASPAASVWVVNAYQLVVTVTLLSLTSLGDIVGYRRVYRAGLLLFTLASGACALAGSMPELVVARVVQGLGAAGIMAVNVVLVRFIYPQALLGRGLGYNALVVAGSAALGPTVASAILAVAGWPWLFAVNLPIGLVGLWAARALPATQPSRHPFDVAGALLNAAVFGLLITGLDGLGHGGWHGRVAAELAGAAVLGVVLVRGQLRRPMPLLPVDLLRRPLFALAIATSACAFVAQMLAFVSLPFHLQGALGRSQVETGLLMTPWPLAVAVAAPVAGRLADRYPAGLLGITGLSLLAAGLGLLAGLPAHPAAAAIVWRMALCGLGFGLFQSPNNRAIMTAVPRERSGGAGGMVGMARLFGQTTGAALVAVLLGRLGLAGSRSALVWGAGFALAGALASGLRLAPRRWSDLSAPH